MGERAVVVLKLLVLPLVLLVRALRWVRVAAGRGLRRAGALVLSAGRSVRAPLDERFPRATNAVLRWCPLPLAVLTISAGVALLAGVASELGTPDHYDSVPSRAVIARVVTPPATVEPYSGGDGAVAVTVVDVLGEAVAVPVLEAEAGDLVTLWLTATPPGDLAAQSSTRAELGGQEWTVTSQVPRGGHRVSTGDVVVMALAALGYAVLAATSLGLVSLGLGLARRWRPSLRLGSASFWVGHGAWKRARERSEVFASWRAATLVTLVGTPAALVAVPLLLAPPLVVQGASYDDYSSANAYAGVALAATFVLGPVFLVLLHAARSLSELAFERLVWGPEATLRFAMVSATPWATAWLERRGLDPEVLAAVSSGHSGTCGELVELVREFDHS